MNRVEPLVTGEYLTAETQKAALQAATGIPLEEKIKNDSVILNSNITKDA